MIFQRFNIQLSYKQASIDQSVLDMEMANRLGWCAFSVIQILGTIAVMSQVAWEVFVIFIPVTAICIWYQVRSLCPDLYLIYLCLIGMCKSHGIRKSLIRFYRILLLKFVI